MGCSNCCVKNCKNTTKNGPYKFYRFPTAKHKLVQRREWISAVRKQNAYDSNWNPKPSCVICSAHFIGNKKGEEELSPSYIPTKFSSTVVTTNDEKSAMNRHQRFMKRWRQNQASKQNAKISKEIARPTSSRDTGISVDTSINMITSDVISDVAIVDISDTDTKKDSGCQASDAFGPFNKFEKTFNYCHRYIFRDVPAKSRVLKRNAVPSCNPPEREQHLGDCQKTAAVPLIPSVRIADPIDTNFIAVQPLPAERNCDELLEPYCRCHQCGFITYTKVALKRHEQFKQNPIWSENSCPFQMFKLNCNLCQKFASFSAMIMLKHQSLSQRSNGRILCS